MESAFSRLYSRRGLWRDGEEIAHHAKVSNVENWSLRVFIDYDDGFTCLHSRAMLNST